MHDSKVQRPRNETNERHTTDDKVTKWRRKHKKSFIYLCSKNQIVRNANSTFTYEKTRGKENTQVIMGD